MQTEPFIRLVNKSTGRIVYIDKCIYKYVKNPQQSKQSKYLKQLPRIYGSHYWSSKIEPAIRSYARLFLRESTYTGTRMKSIETYIIKLLSWYLLQQLILYLYKTNRDRITAIYLNYRYPYYLKNLKEGLTPLPRNLLRKWNFRYSEINRWLTEIGILKKSDYPYVPDAHICRYFHIKIDLNLDLACYLLSQKWCSTYSAMTKENEGEYNHPMCNSSANNADIRAGPGVRIKKKYKDIFDESYTEKDLVKYLGNSLSYTVNLVKGGTLDDFFNDYLLYYSEKLDRVIRFSPVCSDNELLVTYLKSLIDAANRILDCEKITYTIALTYLRCYSEILNSLKRIVLLKNYYGNKS